MRYTDDELLLKEVIEEMGLVWDEAEGCITVNGISAVEFLSSNNIFEGKTYLMRPMDQIEECDFVQDDEFVLAA